MSIVAQNKTLPKNKAFMSSDRSFGILMAFVFFLIGGGPAFFDRPFRIWSLVLSAIFFLLAIFFSILLKPLHTLWLRFGLFLHHLTSPLILFVLFIFVFVPTSVCLKLLKKDILNLRLKKTATTYWINSQGVASNFSDQF